MHLLVVAALAACTHSDPFPAPAAEANGPPTIGGPGQLTFSPERDYWPAWTQDGKGILYSYVDYINVRHRCVGLLPAAGGSRVWEMCDNRTTQTDSVSSFPAYALRSDGKLLYMEASASRTFPGIPATNSLWLADTASPFIRQKLLTLPATVGGTQITWLTDIEWTGPSAFIGLGQKIGTGAVCAMCACDPTNCREDSTFANEGTVVVGMIDNGTATLRAVAGTDSATGYALADNGATVVFIRRDDPRLLKVPIGGGMAAPIATVLSEPGELLGVSCRGTNCVVATAPIVLTYGGDLVRLQVFAHFVDGLPQGDLRLVSLATGEVDIAMKDAAVLATPKASPISGDVVVQRGGIWGHLQTFNLMPADANLRLLTGFLP